PLSSVLPRRRPSLFPTRRSSDLAGIAIADPRIIATTGWTTDELAAAMDAAEPLGEWDFVSLLIGVNNQYRGRPVDDYLGEFQRLDRKSTRLNSSHVKISYAVFCL